MEKVSQIFGQSWTMLDKSDKVGQSRTKSDKVRQIVGLTLVSFALFNDPFRNANQRSAIFVRTGIKLDKAGQSWTMLDKVGKR